MGKKGDVLYAISTSGQSTNILNAISLARDMNINTVGITGRNKGRMNELCDITINVPADSPDRIQEMHIAVGQIICEIIEISLEKKI